LWCWLLLGQCMLVFVFLGKLNIQIVVCLHCIRYFYFISSLLGWLFFMHIRNKYTGKISSKFSRSKYRILHLVKHCFLFPFPNYQSDDSVLLVYWFSYSLWSNNLTIIALQSGLNCNAHQTILSFVSSAPFLFHLATRQP
jgi:hypothetical protein